MTSLSTDGNIHASNAAVDSNYANSTEAGDMNLINTSTDVQPIGASHADGSAVRACLADIGPDSTSMANSCPAHSRNCDQSNPSLLDLGRVSEDKDAELPSPVSSHQPRTEISPPLSAGASKNEVLEVSGDSDNMCLVISESFSLCNIARTSEPANRDPPHCSSNNQTIKRKLDIAEDSTLNMSAVLESVMLTPKPRQYNSAPHWLSSEPVCVDIDHPIATVRQPTVAADMRLAVQDSVDGVTNRADSDTAISASVLNHMMFAVETHDSAQPSSSIQHTYENSYFSRTSPLESEFPALPGRVPLVRSQSNPAIHGEHGCSQLDSVMVTGSPNVTDSLLTIIATLLCPDELERCRRELSETLRQPDVR